jgi:ketosteroid isomerase-like protein
MATMEARLRELLDRQDILDCIQRYCVGVDRHDADLIASAFHPDATDEHGPFHGGPAALAQWANDFHAAGCMAHTHNITTHACEIDGDVAHAQSYCLYGLRRKDGETVAVGCARYVDRLERRDGAWRIALRKTLIEWRGELRAHMPEGYPQGRWDREDPAYQRPLAPTPSNQGIPS